jgi:Domain of unknown function (DUF4136)
MQTRGILALAAAIVLIGWTACASRLRGEVTYDETADFSRYRSFALAPVGEGAPAARPIAEREVRRALEGKGLREADAGSADLVAHILLSRKKKVKLSGSVGAGGEYVGMEVVLVDRARGDRVWSSWAAETYHSGLEAEHEIPKAVDLIFDGYPPR